MARRLASLVALLPSGAHAAVAVALVTGCSSSDPPSSPSTSSGSTTPTETTAPGGPSSSSTSSSSSSSSGGATSSSGGAAACAGKTVASVEACAAPCTHVEMIDSANGPGPNGGQIWCATACTSDADCTHPGEVCDVKGPTTPRVCVRTCTKTSDCSAVGLPECAELNDGRMACF